MQEIFSCLWFYKQAEEAVQFYTSVFEHSRVIRTLGDGEAVTIRYELEGSDFLAINADIYFKHSPTLSFFVRCKTEKEINQLWEKLTQGPVLWELKKYPWAEKYGWCTDRYGVSWQLILADEKNKIAPAFLFTGNLYGQGEKAIRFYTSVFSNSKILTMQKNSQTDTVMHSTFLLNNKEFVLMEGQSGEKYHVTPATSFVVPCDSQKEIDYYWENLTKDGGVPGQCGWLQDQFGFSWQVVPSNIGEMLNTPDKAKADRISKAMLKMQKIDMEVLEKA